MCRSHRKRARHPPVIDLTLSDNETLDSAPQLRSLPQLPHPSQPTRRRRLTARDCLLADRIAFREFDPPSPSHLSAHHASSISNEETLDLTHEITTNQPSLHNSEPPLAEHEPLVNGSCIEDESRARPAEHQTDTSPIVISSPSEAGDSSDDEFVLYLEKDIIDLTTLDDEPEVVEIMASGRPRRSCAPKSFEGLIPVRGRKMFKRVLKVSAVTLTKDERDRADKHRDVLVQKGVSAHHALWENRLTHKFSYNCGRIDVGRARAALVRMGQLFGAHCSVVKKHESGVCAKYVVMKVGNRLCSPSELDVREVADELIDRAFKETVQKKEKTKNRDRSENEGIGTSRKQTKQRETQRKETVAKVAQDVRIYEHACNRVVPLCIEQQRQAIQDDARMKRKTLPASSGMHNRDRKSKGNVQVVNIQQTLIPRNLNGVNDRKRRTQSREGAVKSKEIRRIAWEQKRQRKLEGRKLETGNKGFDMLAKMGWHDGQALGARRNGISKPIVAQFRTGRKGLGTT